MPKDLQIIISLDSSLILSRVPSSPVHRVRGHDACSAPHPRPHCAQRHPTRHPSYQVPIVGNAHHPQHPRRQWAGREQLAPYREKAIFPPFLLVLFWKRTVPVLQQNIWEDLDMRPRGQSHHLSMQEVLDDASHTTYVGVDADEHEGMSCGMGLWRSQKVARWCHC